MAYIFRDESQYTSSIPCQDALVTRRYPDEQYENKASYVTYIAVFPTSHMSWRRAFFARLTGSPVNYSVIFYQMGDKVRSVFALYDGSDESETRKAYEKICSTLNLLLIDGSLFLTKPLLERLIVPSPCPPSELTYLIVEIMESIPDAHSEWHKIVQSLTRSVCTRKDSSRHELNILINKGGKLEHSSVGDSPVPLPSPTPSPTKGTRISKKHKSIRKRFQGMMKPVELHSAARTDDSVKIHDHLVRQASHLLSITVLSDDDEEYLTPTAEPRGSLDHFTIENSFNEINDLHETPLVVSVKQGYIISSLYLLLGGANPNYRHPATGNTSLHIAARHRNVEMIKLLFVFGADPTICNRNGETPIQLLDTSSCFQGHLIIQEVSDLVAKYKKLPSHPVEVSQNDGQFLLALDGGGTRCITQIQMLLAIEKRMKELNPNCYSFLDHFDYIGATSGGAYNALIMTYGEASLANTRALTFSVMARLGNGTPKVKTEKLETILVDMLGEHTVMSDVQQPRVIVTATLADRNPCELHLMTNYGVSRDGQLGPTERKVWEAARITSTAPLYFLPFEKFLDGGLMANNPTLDTMVEMTKQARIEGHSLKLRCVLSLGSGVTESVPVNNVDVINPSLLKFHQIGHNISSLKNLVSLIITQVTQSDGQETERASAWCEMIGASYFRLSPNLISEVALDATDPLEIMQPLFDAYMYTLKRAESIDEIARTLLSNPRLYASST